MFSTCGGGLKFNQNVFGYSHNNPVGFRIQQRRYVYATFTLQDNLRDLSIYCIVLQKWTKGYGYQKVKNRTTA